MNIGLGIYRILRNIDSNVVIFRFYISGKKTDMHKMSSLGEGKAEKMCMPDKSSMFLEYNLQRFSRVYPVVRSNFSCIIYSLLLILLT